ncbi:MAG TPA: DUF6789 family protein [Thermoleophilaceae bacterium]|nr:DUF6789 family protein [Thermoleophilaceae bacterium]
MNEVVHAAGRGVVAAMAMTGMRALTVNLGIVEQAPPQAILKQKAGGLMMMVPRKKRRAALELFHWGYGAAGGATFALLPDELRRRRWAGPAYGLAIWLGFELGVAPLLGLTQSKELRPVDRAGLAADHLLYGLVLSEMRARPQETPGPQGGPGQQGAPGPQGALGQQEPPR